MDATRRRVRLPAWLWVLLAAGSAALAFFLYSLVDVRRARSELTSALAQAEQVGLPTSLSVGEGSKGAAAAYFSTFQAYFAELEDLRINLPGPEEPLHTAYVRHVAKRAKILPEILRATEQAECRFPLPAVELEEPAFEDGFFNRPEERLYELAIWTNREARVASLKGDWETCRRYLGATMRLGDHVGQNYGFPAALASSKIDRGLSTTLSLIAGDHVKDGVWLRNLQWFAKEVPEAFSFQRAMHTELAKARELLRLIVEQDRFDLAAEGPTTDDAAFATMLRREATRLRWEADMVRRFARAYERMPANARDVTKAIEVWKEAFETDDPFKQKFFERFVPDGVDTFKRLPTAPRHQIMAAVLAYLDLRRRTGKHPAVADLGSVGADPYGDGPLRLLKIVEPMVKITERVRSDKSIERTETPLLTSEVRYLLYSVGQNGKDNEGLGDDVYVFIPFVDIVKQ